MALRRLRLEEALENVLSRMRLRRPQREALEAFHRIFLNLDRDLADLSNVEFAERVRDMQPAWSFAGGFPHLTCALATGVGKTRLMGAMAAYLHLSRQSSNFLVLAPRSAILRKFETDAQVGSAKYLFVDASLVPEPVLWHRGNIESFSPSLSQDSLFDRGPSLFVFSPQSLTGDGRRAARVSEFSGVSLVDHLRSLSDLVVMMDEAHHLGRLAERETQAWTNAIRELEPRLQIGMTATPRDDDGLNLLYEYDLATCLREKLYTKDVRVIVRQQSDTESVSPEDWDHHTLDFALDRLQRKEMALENYDGRIHFPSIKPVLLVCAENTAHADEVAAWLVEQRGLTESEVLVTHSERSKSEADIDRLVRIEDPNSSVRVVVNVYELTEGWDVTNVYVIAPLRRMGTFQGAVQTMGRGLRLPAGKRVDDYELDALDVLCFGKESLQEVLASALQEYGSEEDSDTYIQVSDSEEEELAGSLELQAITVPARHPVSISMPEVTRRPVEPDLDFKVSTMREIAERSAVEFNLGSGDVAGTVESLKYDFGVFVQIAASRVVAGLSYLSDPLHRESVEKLVENLLVALGQDQDAPVALNWIQVAEVVKHEIDKPYRRKEIVFDVVDAERTVDFGKFDWRIPVDCGSLPGDGGRLTWNASLRRIPISGWRRCVHEAAPFDTEPELQLARILDRSAGVEWWVRNDPARLRIATPIGNYEPDFVCARGKGASSEVLIVEMKGGLFWQPEDSDARVKSRAADAWCGAVSSARPAPKWSHWVVLDVDVNAANSLEDLESVRVNSV